MHGLPGNVMSLPISIQQARAGCERSPPAKNSQESKEMSLFSKRVFPLTLLGAAAVLGGCVGEASLEGDDEQETQPEAAEAADSESAESIDPQAAEAVETAQQALKVRLTIWKCGRRNPTWWYDYAELGEVTIWWGHTSTDAMWACNNWVGDCRRDCNEVKRVKEDWVTQQ
ncbi:hypothetical protein [Sorangium sp. So ce887]|uniref:hypothetical protein n=1 Tax=Sorangium sp. So ce887 TaxID=3133324 RepID=UPI003F5DC31A